MIDLIGIYTDQSSRCPPCVQWYSPGWAICAICLVPMNKAFVIEAANDVQQAVCEECYEKIVDQDRLEEDPVDEEDEREDE